MYMQKKKIRLLKQHWQGLAAGLQNFYNATGARTCLDPAKDQPDWGTGDGWPYLACTEL
jgi:hypothetical protein